MKRAVVLLSGGLDSATTLAIAIQEGFECHALSVDYGQSHSFELDCAARIAVALGAASHLVISLDLSQLAPSALTGQGEVPRGRSPGHMTGIPASYVPARNTVFLSLALAHAEAIDASDVFIGANAIDYCGYPDCRPEYIEAFQRMANLATKRAVEGKPIEIRAPLVAMSKAAIIERGLILGVDFALTSSCYRPGPSGEPCGECDSCAVRRKGFDTAGIADPADRRK